MLQALRAALTGNDEAESGQAPRGSGPTTL